MKAHLFLISSLLFWICELSPAVPPALAETTILSGKHGIIYDIINPLGVEFLPNYSNNSYSQKVLQEDEFSKRVWIEIKLDPLKSKASFPLSPRHISLDLKSFLQPEKDIPVNDGEIQRQTKKLVQNARVVHEASAAIFNWIVDSCVYDAGPNTPQDGKSVFINRRGSCVGYTQLAIAMLRSAGIPARYAHGYLPPGYDWGISKKYWGVQIKGGGYHAWVEVYYPDIGWVFSDLLHSKDFVDPFHILRYTDGVNLNPQNIQGGSLDVEEAATFTIIKEENSTLAIDQLSFPRKDILARQTGEQQSGTIYGTVKDRNGKSIPKGTLVFWKGDKGKVYPFEKGVYSIPGLESGTFRLSIRAEGYEETEKNIKVTEGEVKKVDIIVLPLSSSKPASIFPDDSRIKP